MSVKPSAYYKLQLDYMEGIDIKDMPPGNLVRFGRLILRLYRKSVQYLRSDPGDKDWQKVKAAAIKHLLDMPIAIELNMALVVNEPNGDRLLMNLLELVSACATELYEELKIEESAKQGGGSAIVDITAEQLAALQRLESRLNAI